MLTARPLRVMVAAVRRRLTPGFATILDWIFGFDLFISYTRMDNLEPYAIELAKRLPTAVACGKAAVAVGAEHGGLVVGLNLNRWGLTSFLNCQRRSTGFSDCYLGRGSFSGSWQQQWVRQRVPMAN
jgi:hypothetical protein